MQAELNAHFTQYEVHVEKRKTRCLVLTRTTETDKLKTRGSQPFVQFDPFGCEIRNAYLGELIGRLDAFYLQNSPYPVVDGTGYHAPVDLAIKANLSDVADLNKALAAYGLRLAEKDQETDLLIIKDRI